MRARGCKGNGHSRASTAPSITLRKVGGISPHSLHFIRRLALRSGERGARARQHRLRRVEHDSTSSAKSFIFVHHTQQLPAPAQVGDAKGTRKKITEIKMCLIKVALKATAGGAKP